MSIRTALIGGISVLLLFSTGVLAWVGIRAIRDGVVREAQSRVDHDLFLFASLYEKELALTAERLRSEVERLGVAPLLRDEDATTVSDLDSPAVLSPSLETHLLEVKRSLGFSVLSVTGPDGVRISGTREGRAPKATPTELDPVIRTALEGQASHGTVLLGADRLRIEGGPALATSQRVPSPEGAHGNDTEAALFQWCAVPVTAGNGDVLGVVYGGRPLNHNHEFVDQFARTLFGERRHGRKPIGTVTIFLGDTRVATNVRDREGNRAIGTRVSDVVRDHVLGRGERWQDRAWVVDSWYLSGYQPLLDPSGRTLGMLYVGLLEAPYDEMQKKAIRRFALPALALLLLAWVSSILLVGRITRPLERLRASADRIADGEWSQALEVGPSYGEIRSLSDALGNMQDAISKRDRQLREKNSELSEANDELETANQKLEAANLELACANEKLAEANEKLEVANENYMSTLGFVTHELKAPLANVQSLIELVLDGHASGLDETGRSLLVRVQRNSEELQGMVKDYLDLSRAERGGLVPTRKDIELRADVVEPSVTLAADLFASRRIQLEVDTPMTIPLSGDPELLRIALGNLLGNAAKYGREGGRTTLELRRERDGEQDLAVLSVWNEGAGFSTSERELLFAKFSRLRNANTKSKKGSGLGLYLTAQIVEQHGGRAVAESEPGEWARFSLRLPIGASVA